MFFIHTFNIIQISTSIHFINQFSIMDKEKAFIILAAITPIEDIILKIESNNFRDCDINYLDEKVQAFTSVALQSLHINIVIPKHVAKDVNKHSKDYYLPINDNRKDYYLRIFRVLLKHFRKYVE